MTDDTEGLPPEETDESVTDAVTPPAKLAGGKLTLKLPTSIPEQWDIYLTSLRVPQVSFIRVYAAAIGLMWPEFRRMLAKRSVIYNGDILAYGGQVQQILFSGSKPAAERVDLEEFRAAGKAAVNMVTDAIVSGEAVEAAKDFT